MPPPRVMPSYVLGSVLTLLGLAFLLAFTLISREDGSGPSPPFVHPPDTSCTDIIVADTLRNPLAHVGGAYQDPWSLLGLPRPADGILPDLHTLKATFVYKVKEAQEAGASIKEVQGLCYAYQAVLNATALLLREQQYQQLRLMRPSTQVTTIANEDVQRVVKHLEKDRNAFADQSARMEQWGSFLENGLQASKREIQELEGRLRLAVEHARCAPSWNGAWAEFTQQRCTQGEDKRVRSTELHDAFVEFLTTRSPQGEVPAHKTFRELLEHLGYAYDQVYVSGTNKRGFRGIALKPFRSTP